jgi:exonuclease SbcC
MTVTRLESISVNNFRSIGGRITVPLDGQVVIIYGQNGGGKTSLLSALEFSLTGSIEAMERVDANYREHLVHRGANAASISISAHTSGDIRPQTWLTSFEAQQWIGESALAPVDARYFSERCYLAQATLGRLLEIYGRNERGQGSALTRFVNDVLGLDALENLLEGLQQAVDVRNARRLVPEIVDVERDLKDASKREAINRDDYNAVSNRQKEIEQDILEVLSSLGIEARAVSPDVLDIALNSVQVEADNDELGRWSGYSREIVRMLAWLSDPKNRSTVSDLSALELEAQDAEDTATRWFATSGAKIDDVIARARIVFNDLPSIAETNPVAALTAALDRVEGEAKRIRVALASDDAARVRLAELDQVVGREHARVAIIDEQVAAETAGAAEIARLLAELLPHLRDNECLLCGRDYSEVSQEPLAAEVAHRASRFDEQAERLASLSRAKFSATAELEQALDASGSIRSQVLESSARSSLIARQASLEEWIAELAPQSEEAARGSDVISAASAARRALASAKAKTATWSEFSQSAAQIADELKLPPVSTVEPLEQVLRQIDAYVQRQTASVEARQALRRKLDALWQSWSQVSETLGSQRVAYETAQQQRERLEVLQRNITSRRERAKEIYRTAATVQQTIIQTVFNENLNSVWRDLFIRLAPREVFIPGFQVNDSQSRTPTPQLITSYRGGGQGGSPGAMLSAGNLNTAALTLFLALHLVAGQRLPMLVLDDPVQSMDDVHISQFAALLRTLSKQHACQVILAVHERALFDYLALELSPAFEGDRLITVELKKHAEGNTSADPKVCLWENDPISISA